MLVIPVLSVMPFSFFIKSGLFQLKFGDVGVGIFFIYLLGFIVQILLKLYKYAILNKIVYIRMSNTCDCLISRITFYVHDNYT